MGVSTSAEEARAAEARETEAPRRAQVEAFDRAQAATGLTAVLDPETAREIGAAGAVRITAPTRADTRTRVIGVDVRGRGSAASGTVLLDALTRRALALSLGDEVLVQAADVTAIGLLRVEIDARVGAGDEVVGRLRRHLVAEGIVLSSGAVVALPIGADDSLVVVRVVDSDVAGACDGRTFIEAEAADLVEFLRPSNGGLEDVGGNDQAISELREAVQLAIVHPEVYARLGIRPSRGVILQGPPGTGKSLLCRSLAGEIDAAFYYISGPEVVGTLHGQTEEGLRSVFADAIDHSPAIICIDEVDALTRNRRALASQADMRAVAQLLALMDGLRRAPGVFVIGTTNRVDLLDPAFRRPGRFDREIVLTEPDARGRLEILQTHTRGMPLSRAARGHLPALADDTLGFTGADLWALSQRAGLATLRRAAEHGGIHGAAERLASQVAIGVADLDEARAATSPSSVRDGHVVEPRPARLVGSTRALERLRALVDSAQAGVLLSGASGSGKTSYVHSLAAESGRRLIVVNGPELSSRWMGDAEEAMRHLGELARRVSPSILLLERVEAIAPRASGAAGSEARLAGQLAGVLSDLSSTTDVLVVGTTADPGAVDPAVLGSTGMRIRLEIDAPVAADLAELFRVEVAEAGLRASEADLARFAEAAVGLTPADVKTAVSLGRRAADGGEESLAEAIIRETAALTAAEEGTR